jgi:uncharacterized YccA/Bax inhibitor family protein
MRTGNPALGENSFIFPEKAADAMSLQGTVNKSFLLIAMTITSAAVGWKWALADIDSAGAIMGISGLLGFVLAVVTIFSKKSAFVTAPLYALAEGLMLGGISGLVNQRFPGIAFQAIALTFGVFLCLLGAYKTGLIRATENFKLGVVAATGAYALYLLGSFVAHSLFGMQGVPLIHQNGLLGIGLSAFVVVLAALNLVLDFDFIEDGVNRGAPKYMEWYAAFGLLVTLVWLYIEILRLLAKLQSRR